MTDKILRVKDLCKTYKLRTGNIIANENINFTVSRGEMVAFLGPNGSGKTTLIKQIIGYIEPTSGVIEIFGKELRNKNRNLDRIGYMMQTRYSHWDHLSAGDAMYYTGRLKKLSKSTTKSQIESLSKRLNLEKELNVTLERMSGGKKQAVALACAVIGNPELVVLDEPTNELDPEMRRYVWDFIRQLSESQGISIILITHNSNEIEVVADEIKIFANARIIKEGNPREMIRELNQKIRMELTMREDWKGDRDGFLANYEKRWSGNILFVYVEQDSVVSCIKEVFTHYETSKQIENIQMKQPNLEDVYIRLMGAKIE